MESTVPEFQEQLSRIEELINALNATPDSVVSAKSRELPDHRFTKLLGAWVLVFFSSKPIGATRP
jgi:hypothetical protein